MLPDITRWIVAFPLCFLYPPLIHQIVARRTAFLDHIVYEEVDWMASRDADLPVRVITLGAGFDTRSIRFLNNQTLFEPLKGENKGTSHSVAFADYHEIDLPIVIQQKRCMYGRLISRRPKLKLPQLYEADLNYKNQVTLQLKKIFSSHQPKKCHTIFVFEAVLLYLKKESVKPLLKACVAEASRHSHDVTLCFADRFPVDFASKLDLDDYSERSMVETFLKPIGFRRLLDYQPRRCIFMRHMGRARLTADP
jgi:ethanolamine utilization protein EutP (predicted NTPase)